VRDTPEALISAAGSVEPVQTDAEQSDELPSLLDLLQLEEIDRDLYRANQVFPDRLALYGGQVAAQALLAAGRTVGTDRQPHSLHGYFLRSGDAARPTIFRVDRDRDGRSYSARRVVAVQGGEVLFNMSCSFHVEEQGPDVVVQGAPEAGDPDTLPELVLPRLFSIEARQPEQPYDDPEWPTLFWARAQVPLPEDPLVHACALTYLSDISTGLFGLEGARDSTGPSLDHALWFHRPPRMDDWVLTQLVPSTVARGRGWYTGAIYDRRGELLASLAQESLYRSPRRT
jgi:acyl-CoA thioesterase-2